MLRTEAGVLLAERYRLVRRLGVGSMATVWAARDELLERLVAIKRLHTPTEEAPRRFAREARLGAGLKHPNLIEVYDVVQQDLDVLLIMEYVEGGSLAEALERGAL